MSFEAFLFLLLFSAICGVVGQAINGHVRGGIAATLAVGFIGALFGTWLAALAGLPSLFTINIGGLSFPIIWSFLGTALLMAVVGLFIRRYYVA